MYGRQRPHRQSGSDRGSSGRRSSGATTTSAGRSTAPTGRSRVGVGREFADVDRRVARPSSLESQSSRTGQECASPPPGTAATHGHRVTQSGELNEVDRPPTHPGSRWRACTTFAWQCPEGGEPDGPASSVIQACALQSNPTCSRVVDTPDGPEPGSSSTRGGFHDAPLTARGQAAATPPAVRTRRTPLDRRDTAGARGLADRAPLRPLWQVGDEGGRATFGEGRGRLASPILAPLFARRHEM